MARRSKHEGSVHQLDGRWIAVIELPRTPGGRRVRRRRVADTKTEALRLLREMRSEIERNGSTTDSRRSVADAVESYWQRRQGAGRSAETLDRDRWMLDTITDGLGRKRIASLSVLDCDAFLAEVANGLPRPNGSRRRPFVRDHVSRTRSMLRRVLNNEMRLGLLARNVADLSVLPETKKEGRVHRILTPDELALLLDVATGATLVFVDLMGRNGLRPQEARALEWSAVDFDESTLHVGPQMNRKGVIVGPKTPRADRTIHLDGSTLDRLASWRSEQAAQRNRAGELWITTYDLIITTRVGSSIEGGNIARSLARLSKQLGIDPPIIPYDLRHSAVTLQARPETGYSDWELADWAGTSERMINEVYRHRTERVVSVQPVDVRSLR